MADDLTTVEVLRRVAVHVVARARAQATGRFSLRVAPGGFATPEFGDGRRVRVTGDLLIVEDDRSGRAGARAVALAGATLAQLAEVAGVDLSTPLDVGHDTPASGDPHEPLVLDPRVVGRTAEVFAVADAGLGRVIADGVVDPTLVRLWPEHFDVAIDAEVRPGVRVNLGASPGDATTPEPYLYVGPWTEDRPGDDGFWNAPFGATRRWSVLADDRVRAAHAFWSEGVRRLAG